ncbi:hypothetical protein CEQ31_013815 [Serratia odorifera]|nr:hypothetical protein CEQ31_013815 [Serratia odorifera]RII71720.1 hypothetical protein DX901_12540 [Serratia odorifera]
MNNSPRGVFGVERSFTGLSLEFFTHLSTEKVNKSPRKSRSLFITLPLSVSYPNVIRDAALQSSGLPPVACVKQSEHLYEFCLSR